MFMGKGVGLGLIVLSLIGIFWSFVGFSVADVSIYPSIPPIMLLGSIVILFIGIILLIRNNSQLKKHKKLKEKEIHDILDSKKDKKIKNLEERLDKLETNEKKDTEKS